MKRYRNSEGLEVNDLSGVKPISYIQKEFGGTDWQEAPLDQIDQHDIERTKILNELRELDLRSIRSIRVQDKKAMADFEAQAEFLRNKLNGL